MTANDNTRRIVLVVEDDRELRHLACALLEETPLAVIEVDTAEEALAVMRAHGGDVAMLFVDIRLPGPMDGAELARSVAKLWPRTLVVVTSGAPGDRLARLPTSVSYMQKPWRGLDVLMQAERAVRNPPTAIR